MNSLNKIYQFLFYALVFVIPYEDDVRAVPNLLLIALTILLPFAEKKLIFKIRNNNIYLYTFLFVIVIGLTSFMSSSFSNDIYVIKKLLLIFPILILSIPIKQKEGMMIAFVLSIILGNLISLLGLGMHILQSGTFEIATGNEINDILFVERLYSGILNCLGIAFSFKLMALNNRLKKAMIANVIFSLFMIFLVVSRMAMLLSLIICFIKIFSFTSRKKALMLTGFGIVVLTVFLVLNQNFYKRFLYNSNEVNLFEKIKAWEPRFVIWSCGYEIAVSAENKFLIGNGFLQTQQSLNNCYNNYINKKKKLDYFLNRRFNSHNQYLDLFLSKGIIGLSLFLGLIFLLFKQNKKDSDLLSVLLVLVFYMLIENVFHRQIGVYLTGLIIVVLGLHNREIEKINE
ncbi:O-antigen ligase family protein [Winogradskyella vincentii]|uniref:O-antigen ligase family protein n=1 Tax=Winogradskyella vincentii TaxID=2877122 RepID=A0ABS7Y0W9_9FLAO|nr:O-antigen ligase family protein [Winogradskyella vincentii]MCA0152368.1 O-antigen ligase family protein [Winogradskyella vincentii]